MTLNEQRARLLRLLVGSILANVGEESEIHSYCALLATDSRIGADMAELLASIVEAPRGRKLPPKQGATEAASAVGPIDNILGAVQRDGISKRRCLEAMKRANPRFLVPKGVDKMAVKDLIKKYVIQSTPEQVAKLLDLISPLEIDPYLRRMGRES
jgi:hypothetical protein